VILTLNWPPQQALTLGQVHPPAPVPVSADQQGRTCRRPALAVSLLNIVKASDWAISRQRIHGIAAKGSLAFADGQMCDGALWLVLASLARIYPFRRVNRAIHG